MPQPIIVLVFIGLINWSCNKPEILPTEACETLAEIVDWSGNPLFKPVYPTIGQPCLNPNNPDELIYIFSESNTQNNPILVKYNITTKTESIIHEDHFTLRPRWSKKGWIIFSVLNYNIHKIKDNGDSLTQLTFYDNSFSPEWDITGEKFISRISFTNPTKYLIHDESGNAIDTTFAGIVGNGSWQHPELTTYANNRGLVVGNPATGLLDTLFLVDTPSSISSGAEWIDEERVIWTHLDGIRITNISTNETTLIRETCNAKYYQLPTYSSINNKVIFQVIERKKTNNTGGILFSYLVRMNIDGTEEEIIKFLYH